MRQLNTSTGVAIASIACTLFSASARADDSFTPVEGPGILISERSILHPSVGAEVGLDSNVFREESDGFVAPLIRLSAALAIASLPEERLQLDEKRAQQKIEYRFGVSAAYSEFLSSNDNVQAQRNLNLGSDLDLNFFPKEVFTFRIQNNFDRIQRPRNFESDGRIARDINRFRASAGIQPGGGTIYLGAYYENLLDYFESSASRFANRFNHDVGARLSWQWRPFTQFWADASYGFYDGFQSAAQNYKVASNPLRIRGGVATAITERLTLDFYGGYARGNYDARASYSAPTYGAKAGYRYSPTGRVVLSYDREYQDSINANFFGDHVGRLSIDQSLNQVVLNAYVSARDRSYEGLSASLGGNFPTRDDTIFDAGLGAKWWLSEKLVLNADYYYVYDDTDFRTNVEGLIDDPSFTRHALFVGLNLAY